MNNIFTNHTDLDDVAISPYKEMLSYETLWATSNMTEKKISKLFSKGGVLPSEAINFLNPPPDNSFVNKIKTYIDKLLGKFSICLNGDMQYPNRLRDAKYPVDLFYYRGELSLIDTPCISIVGSRKHSKEGGARARKLSKLLVDKGYTIVSGLASGIDTEALQSAISNKGNVIAVIGTPINNYYPKENKQLQDKIADEHLLISQVPFYRYNHEHFLTRKVYFPRRNATMSAISLATVIVEASERSGALTQARAAIQQKRHLFILNSCFENPNISWPKHYEKQGAIRVKNILDILEHLKKYV